MELFGHSHSLWSLWSFYGKGSEASPRNVIQWFGEFWLTAHYSENLFTYQLELKTKTHLWLCSQSVVYFYANLCSEMSVSWHTPVTDAAGIFPDSQTRIKCAVNHTAESDRKWFSQRFADAFFPPRTIRQLRSGPPILPPGHRKWVPQWARHWRLILQETGSALTCLREDDISFIISFPFRFQLMSGKEALLKGGAFVDMIPGAGGMCYHTRISGRRVHTWLCDIWTAADVTPHETPVKLMNQR